jgi:murein DD-endopeptidase MepM/ murein hydrolase activator NlpD
MATAKERILSEVGRKIGTSETLPKTLLGAFALSIAGALTAMAIPASGLPETAPTTTAIESINLFPRAVEGAGEARFFREEQVLRNDTLTSLLERLGIGDPAAYEFVRTSPWAKTMAQQTRPGKVVAAETSSSGALLRLLFPLGQQDSFLVIEPVGDGSFSAKQEVMAGTREVVVRSAVIRNSLFAATDDAGIPDGIAVQIAEIFSGEIDFHRDLQKGDRLVVVYELVSQRGLPVRAGKVLSAEFQQGRRTLNAFYFEADSVNGYFDAQGKSLRKAFLRSPLEFSRVTSRFSGSRFHPVLKEWRAHRGVDYGAPIGTRVRATADGQVTFVGRQGGYGNLILLKHGSTYTTAYGHLNGFAPGLRVGQRVQQGDLIGYVGRTGLASGPHLHYEFRVGERQVNPLTVPLPEAGPLTGPALASFIEQRRLASHRLAIASRGPASADCLTTCRE